MTKKKNILSVTINGQVVSIESETLEIPFLISKDMLDIQAINGLEKLGSLKKLEIGSSNIKEIRGLETLESLEHLTIKHAQISDISSLSTLKRLKTLDFSNNQISNIEPIAHLTQLENLVLNWNKIENINSLNALKKLKYLKLHRNEIKLVNLQGLSELTRLDLSWNQIESVSFKGLDHLESLGLSNNKLKTLDFLAGLKNLKGLSINLNPIYSTLGLKHVPNLESIDGQIFSYGVYQFHRHLYDERVQYDADCFIHEIHYKPKDQEYFSQSDIHDEAERLRRAHQCERCEKLNDNTDTFICPTCDHLYDKKNSSIPKFNCDHSHFWISPNNIVDIIRTHGEPNNLSEILKTHPRSAKVYQRYLEDSRAKM